MSPVHGERGNTKAETLDEIKPVIELCRAGKLFAVQDWITEGKPVNLPHLPRRSNHARSPLDIAIEQGFHSLVEVLLKTGATLDLDSWNGTMSRALRARRFDIVQLLVDHGYDPASIDMNEVFGTWAPEMMEYFIDRGAEVEAGNPLASALCNRVRTALRVLKRYWDRFPSFPEQANIALRYHCKEGNLKWISLLLWAGADPYARGVSQFDEELDPTDTGLSALGYAVLYQHFEVFKLKQVKLDPAHPAIWDVVRYAYRGQGIELLKRLLEKGLNPNDQESGGSSLIQNLLNGIGFDFSAYTWRHGPGREKLDSETTRDKIKTIHLLAKHGAKWVPKDRNDVNDARRSLLKLKADYTVEFAWIMAKYRSCAKDRVLELVATPTIKAHLSGHAGRLREILSAWQ